MCTSSLPGLKTASSIKSFRLVIPITKMLFRALTPSIWVRSWLTTKSPALDPPDEEPLCFTKASNSSNTMMCRGEAGPIDSSSSRALSKSFLTFSSDSPTYLLKIQGPFTTLNSLAFKYFPSCRAMRVFPVPGGPQSRIPLMCLMPSFSTTPGGNLLLAKALLKMLANSSPKPPIPMSEILKSGRNKLTVSSGPFSVLSFSPCLIVKTISVWSTILPILSPLAEPSLAPISISSTLLTVAASRYCSKLMQIDCLALKNESAKLFFSCVASFQSSISMASWG